MSNPKYIQPFTHNQKGKRICNGKDEKLYIDLFKIRSTLELDAWMFAKWIKNVQKPIKILVLSTDEFDSGIQDHAFYWFASKFNEIDLRKHIISGDFDVTQHAQKRTQNYILKNTEGTELLEIIPEKYFDNIDHQS